MATDIILVTGRSSERTIEALDMKCDAHEIPDSPDGAKADGYWLCLATMKGTAPSLTQGELSDASEEFASTGTAALALVKGRLLGILGPGSPTEQAVWFTRPPGELSVRGIGSQGTVAEATNRARADGSRLGVARQRSLDAAEAFRLLQSRRGRKSARRARRRVGLGLGESVSNRGDKAKPSSRKEICPRSA